MARKKVIGAKKKEIFSVQYWLQPQSVKKKFPFQFRSPEQKQ